MQQRIDIRALEPASYQAMIALERSVASAGLDERTRHLVKLRASFLNGCAYCIDMHSAEGREAGIPESHLFGVAAWQEAPFFSDRERAALALTDAATQLRDGVPDTVWQDAVEHWGEPGTAKLVFVIAAINAWNRLAIAARTTPRSALRRDQ
jgi:AhpD family alkylhydroperoxidase